MKSLRVLKKNIIFFGKNFFLLNQNMGLERIATIDAPDTSVSGFGGVTKIYGNTMVVASGGNGTPAQSFVYVYQRSNDGTWNLKQTIRATDVTDKSGTGVLFGVNLDIYENYIVIGQGNQGLTPAVPGEAHIFVRGNDGTWTLKQTLQGDDTSDQFGFGVSLSGNNLLVGALAGGAAGGAGNGAAYWYTRGNDGTYTRVYKRLAPSGTSQFGGINVSLSGNYASVGAPGAGNGAIYFYYKGNDGNWTEISGIDGTADLVLSGGYYMYKNFAVSGGSQGGGGDGSVGLFTRNNSGEWLLKNTVRGEDSGGVQNLGSSFGIYGNFVYAISNQDPDDATSSLISLYSRNAEGNLDLVDSARVPQAATVNGTDSSDIYGNYIVLGGTLSPGGAGGGQVFVYQYKN